MFNIFTPTSPILVIAVLILLIIACPGVLFAPFFIFFMIREEDKYQKKLKRQRGQLYNRPRNLPDDKSAASAKSAQPVKPIFDKTTTASSEQVVQKSQGTTQSHVPAEEVCDFSEDEIDEFAETAVLSEDDYSEESDYTDEFAEDEYEDDEYYEDVDADEYDEEEYEEENYDCNSKRFVRDWDDDDDYDRDDDDDDDDFWNSHDSFWDDSSASDDWDSEAQSFADSAVDGYSDCEQEAWLLDNDIPYW